MKRGFPIFLVFIAVGAVFFGMSIALISHFPNVARGWQEERQVTLPANSVEEKAPPAPTTSTANYIPIPSEPRNSSTLFLTREEETQVLDMLRELGYTGNGFADTVIAYQKSNSLEETGFLSTETLESIIRQLTVNSVLST
jgi:hypothetical protein